MFEKRVMDSEEEIDFTMFSTLFSNPSLYNINYENDEGYILIEKADSFLSTLISDIISDTDEDILQHLQSFMASLLSHGEYDARSRIIVKSVFNILNYPRSKLQIFEAKIMMDKSNAEHKTSFTDVLNYKTENSNFPVATRRHNLYRMLQVGAAAAVGGALMCMATTLSAPGVIETAFSLYGT